MLRVHLSKMSTLGSTPSLSKMAKLIWHISFPWSTPTATAKILNCILLQPGSPFSFRRGKGRASYYPREKCNNFQSPLKFQGVSISFFTSSVLAFSALFAWCFRLWLKEKTFCAYESARGNQINTWEKVIMGIWYAKAKQLCFAAFFHFHFWIHHSIKMCLDRFFCFPSFCLRL